MDKTGRLSKAQRDVTHRKDRKDKEEEYKKRRNTVIPSVAGESEKLMRIFRKHHNLVYFLTHLGKTGPP